MWKWKYLDLKCFKDEYTHSIRMSKFEKICPIFWNQGHSDFVQYLSRINWLCCTYIQKKIEISHYKKWDNKWDSHFVFNCGLKSGTKKWDMYSRNCFDWWNSQLFTRIFSLRFTFKFRGCPTFCPTFFFKFFYSKFWFSAIRRIKNEPHIFFRSENNFIWIIGKIV